MYLKNTRKF